MLVDFALFKLHSQFFFQNNGPVTLNCILPVFHYIRQIMPIVIIFQESKMNN